MNFLQGYDSSDDDEKDNEKTVSNDINEDVNNEDDKDNDNDNDGERVRLERATRKRIKLRNDNADLPEEFFIAKPGENTAEESHAPTRPSVVSPPVRSLIPPQLARRRANKSTEDDAVQYGSSSKTPKK